MKLSDFNYKLPKELIANCHMEPRDHSRLLVVDRSLGDTRDKQNRKTEDKYFYDILAYLNKGDILVFNNSKVFKARIYGKKETGGRIEMLLVRPSDRDIVGAIRCGRPNSIWEVLIKGKVRVGDKIIFAQNTENNPEVRPTGVPLGRTSGRVLEAEIIEKKERSCIIGFNVSVEKVFKYLEENGEVPLPPYIQDRGRGDSAWSPKIGRAHGSSPTGFYQTVYAKSVGSVAAPTAGFHFTPELIKKIKAKGVEILEVTLHVGPGTFLPVESENVTDHKMHEEFFEVKRDVWNRIVEARRGVSKKRIIAVGTTTCRVLETLGANLKSQITISKQKSKSKNQNENCIIENLLKIENCELKIVGKNDFRKDEIFKREDVLIGSTDIFIYPPYDFQIVDALITNFHLPKSTLMMLVSAFLAPGKKTGIALLRKIYQGAVKKRYRFYSFGDSMFIK